MARHQEARRANSLPCEGIAAPRPAADAGAPIHDERTTTMELTIHTTDTAPTGSTPLLTGIAEDLGFVPNLAGVAAGSAALLAGFDGLRRAVGSEGVDPAL